MPLMEERQIGVGRSQDSKRQMKGKERYSMQNRPTPIRDKQKWRQKRNLATEREQETERDIGIHKNIHLHFGQEVHFSTFDCE